MVENEGFRLSQVSAVTTFFDISTNFPPISFILFSADF